MNRRRWGIRLVTWSLGLLGALTCGALRSATGGLLEKYPLGGGRARERSSESEVPMDELRQIRRRAEEQEAKEVERLYSAKVIEVALRTKSFRVPVNYMTPKGKDEPLTLEVDTISVVMFLPDFVGYTKENWSDPFDPNRITVATLSAEGSSRSESEKFAALRPLLEDQPSLRSYDLKGYFYKNRENKGIYWTGYRSDGSFFYLESSLAPGEPRPFPHFFPLCSTRYYSASEQLYIAYRYPMQHMSVWRAIDDGIWARIREWRKV